MPSWILNCASCGSNFTQSVIEPRKLEDHYLPAKPELAPEGAELECPGCGQKATYQRSDLRYQA
jgi:DNA-directed RNA polymerase subunit RPC12/RpoP